MFRVFGAGDERKAQADQRVEQPALGDFNLAPLLQIAGAREIRDGAVVAARLAEDLA